jgi:hypothetical protein
MIVLVVVLVVVGVVDGVLVEDDELLDVDVLLVEPTRLVEVVDDVEVEVVVVDEVDVEVVEDVVVGRPPPHTVHPASGRPFLATILRPLPPAISL